MRHNPSSFFFFLIISFTSFGGANCWAETVDLAIHRRCDPIYKAPGCLQINSNNMDFKDRLASSTGINMERSTREMIKFRAVTVDLDATGGIRALASSVAGAVNVQGDVPAPINSGDSGVETENGNTSNGQAQQAMNQGQQQQGMGNNGAQGASLNQPAVNVQNPGSGVTTVGGMMYSDEGDPELQEIKAPGTTSPGEMMARFDPEQAAINANRGLDTGNGSSGSGGGSGGRSPNAMGGGGVGAGQFGQIDNSPTPTQSGSGGGITGQLKALAAALGQGAMNVAGSLGLGEGGGGGTVNSSGRRVGPNGEPIAKAEGQAAKAANNERLRNLLKDRFGRYISSSKSMEFGAADSLMFQGMCGHYSAYATKNRIPTYHDKSCTIEEQ